MIIECDLCEKEFNRKPSQFNKRKQHFCSIECRNKGIIYSISQRQKMSEGAKSLKGTKRSPQACRNIALGKMGTKHPLWKGDNVGYKSLHDWIKRNFGKPNCCEVCGTTTSKKFEWANLGTYNRERKNWKRMCCSCHQKYDNKIANLSKYMKEKIKVAQARNSLIMGLHKNQTSVKKISEIFAISQVQVYNIIKTNS